MSPSQARALGLDALCNQVCSLLRRRPTGLTERDVDTLRAASETLAGLLRGWSMISGGDEPDLTERDVWLAGLIEDPVEHVPLREYSSCLVLAAAERSLIYVPLDVTDPVIDLFTQLRGAASP